MEYTIESINKMNLKEVEDAIRNENWSKPFLMQILLNRKETLINQ